jgi:hypothetical protein
MNRIIIRTKHTQVDQQTYKYEDLSLFSGDGIFFCEIVV